MVFDSTQVYCNGIPSEGVFLSVCLSTYKVENLVTTALEAIFAQDTSDFELVISDDCSPDDTARVVKEWLAEHDQGKFPVSFYRSDVNHGIVENRLRGISYAKGQWMMFADGDDYLAPDACSRLNVELRKLSPMPSLVKIHCEEGASARYYPPGDPVYGHFPLGSNGYIVSRGLFERFADCWPQVRIIADDPFFGRRAMLSAGVWELEGVYYHGSQRSESASGGGVSGKTWILDRKVRWEQLLQDIAHVQPGHKVPRDWRRAILHEHRKMILDAKLIDCPHVVWPFLWLYMIMLSPREAVGALKKRIKLVVKGSVNATWR